MTDHTHPDPASADSVDWEAVARYFAGESSAEEGVVVRRWLDGQTDEARATLTLDRAASSLAFRPPPDLDVEEALMRVRARMDAPTVVPISSRAPAPSRLTGFGQPRNRWNVVGWWSLAAAAVVAAIVVANTRRSGPAVPAGSTAMVAPAIQYMTAAGQRDSIQLPDGSRVVLGPESRLVAVAGYGRGQRTVELHGMAYFDVRHDATKPFLVRDGDATVEDIGTMFTVRDLADGSVRVAVTAGSVRLGTTAVAGAASVVLGAGDRGDLDTAGRTHAYRGGAGDDDLAWTKGRVLFREASFAEVAAELHLWYGVEVRGDATLGGRHLTASFTSEPVDQVLRILALDLGARVERSGDTAIFHATRDRR